MVRKLANATVRLWSAVARDRVGPGLRSDAIHRLHMEGYIGISTQPTKEFAPWCQVANTMECRGQPSADGKAQLAVSFYRGIVADEERS